MGFNSNNVRKTAGNVRNSRITENVFMTTLEPEPAQPAVRPRSEDALLLPSRVGNRLYYRDGRVEKIA
jgi:hypothetical protein